MTSAELYIDHRPVCPVIVASTWGGRARGMMWRRPLPEALIVIRALSAHGAGMREPLDMALLDDEGKVVETRVLGAWRRERFRPRGNVLEAPAGSFARWGLRPGTQVAIVPR